MPLYFMTYVDGFVIPIKKKNLRSYRAMAKKGGKIWKKYGALQYFECVGDDLHPKWIKTTFPKIARTKKDETVFFSFIIYKSKRHRDQVNAKVMKDPEMSDEHWKDKPMPFDMKRMTYGGFKTVVEA